jgi:hypothetical protein
MCLKTYGLWCKRKQTKLWWQSCIRQKTNRRGEKEILTKCEHATTPDGLIWILGTCYKLCDNIFIILPNNEHT